MKQVLICKRDRKHRSNPFAGELDGSTSKGAPYAI